MAFTAILCLREIRKIENVKTDCCGAEQLLLSYHPKGQWQGC